MSETRSTPSPASPSRSLPIGRIAIAIVVLAAAVLLAREAGGAIPRFAAWVDGLGFWGPLVFVLGYAAAVPLIPGSALTLAAGAIFGVLEGTLYVLVAAILGSTLAFLIARYLARDSVERRIAQDPRFAAVDRAIGREGRKIVFLLRLSPVFPFQLLNYALGLTGIRLIDYLVAGLGMLPGTLLFVYSGKVAGDVAAAAGGAGTAKGPGDYALLGIGLVATLVVTTIVTRIARRALDEATGADDPREENEA